MSAIEQIRKKTDDRIGQIVQERVNKYARDTAKVEAHQVVVDEQMAQMGFYKGNALRSGATLSEIRRICAAHSFPTGESLSGDLIMLDSIMFATTIYGGVECQVAKILSDAYISAFMVLYPTTSTGDRSYRVWVRYPKLAVTDLIFRGGVWYDANEAPLLKWGEGFIADNGIYIRDNVFHYVSESRVRQLFTWVGYPYVSASDTSAAASAAADTSDAANAAADTSDVESTHADKRVRVDEPAEGDS